MGGYSPWIIIGPILILIALLAWVIATVQAGSHTKRGRHQEPMRHDVVGGMHKGDPPSSE